MTLVIAVVLTLPAVFVVHGYTELSNNYDFPPLVGQGLKAGAVLLAGTVVDAARLLGAAPRSSAASPPR